MSAENVTKAASETFDKWATDMNGPVALCLKQRLLPVQESGIEGGIVFPPTYADIGYNIDELSDGTRVATIDSVGSQANRLEPLFKAGSETDPSTWLVPPIEISVRKDEPCGVCDPCKTGKKGAKCSDPRTLNVSLLELAHRAADATVMSSPTLAERIAPAFAALKRGDARPLCAIAPTSLVFGVWDSRGGTGEKRPRLVRSIIRAWDVEPLHAAAQFTSIWKLLDESQQKDLLSKEKSEDKRSAAGLADSPATFRKVAKGVSNVRDGAVNPDARVLGGVIVRGRIEREVTVNFIALRGLRGKDGPEGKETLAIRKYLLGLSLMAATADLDLFLREGCLLRYSDEGEEWLEVPRRGDPTKVGLARKDIEDYAKAAATHFHEDWKALASPKDGKSGLVHDFDLKRAQELLKKTEEPPKAEP